ncbi:hypothetical protein Hypma_006658 [Hypsizygus marmoreus]|uniref:F-box domain-containing protein n=1 Tax=Hypsizygus marmoreus TaxID=39966 RepID=A0A369K0Q4_HYPMA|nr:hypothetical protein Hypma_006658 [Hypsizygus marmoreus]
MPRHSAHRPDSSLVPDTNHTPLLESPLLPHEHRYSGKYDGFLERLTEVPLDILFEIFSHLHPLDLLRLARTTKTLRSILMQRSATSVWKATISNVDGLPPCPPDLDEPEYVNLAFDDHCHFCFVSGVNDIFWSCRVRCCKSCVDEHFVSEYDLKKKIPLASAYKKSRAIFPFIVYPKPRPYKPGRILFYLPIAERYVTELAQLQGTCSQGTLRDWSRKKTEEQDRRLSHAALCESWSSHWVHKRSSEVNLLIIVFLVAAC